VKRSRVEKSSLTINGKLSNFKSQADFAAILEKEGQAYFDRARYISVLDAYDEPILFFRPRQFGKLLTVDTLAYFHDLRHTEAHESVYQGLDVQNDVAEGRVIPGQFFILKIEFSIINPCPNMRLAHQRLVDCLNSSIGEFYDMYAGYLGGNLTELHRNINTKDPNLSLKKCVLAVQSALSQAYKQENKQLANVQGVRIHCSLLNLSQLLISKLGFIFYRSICSLTSTTLLVNTLIIPMTPHGTAPRLNELSNLSGLR
jgi:Predicted AAA-ATPase